MRKKPFFEFFSATWTVLCLIVAFLLNLYDGKEIIMGASPKFYEMLTDVVSIFWKMVYRDYTY